MNPEVFNRIVNSHITIFNDLTLKHEDAVITSISLRNPGDMACSYLTYQIDEVFVGRIYANYIESDNRTFVEFRRQVLQNLLDQLSNDEFRCRACPIFIGDSPLHLCKNCVFEREKKCIASK